MPIDFFQRRKILKNANYLDLTPLKLHNEEVDENGLVTVLIPKFTNPIAKKVLNPRLKAKYIKIKLDELGSAAWNQVDGEKTVHQIAGELIKVFGVRIHPVEERLTKFFTGLYMQDIISFNEIRKKGD